MKTEEAPQRLSVSVKDACQLIGVSSRTMWSLIGEGRVETFKIGRKRLVIYESLQQLVQKEARPLGPGIKEHEHAEPSNASD
jgi:excisionase family DNA binding protein